MSFELTPRRPRHFQISDQARALTIVLLEEFGVPFTLYDAVGGEVLTTGACAELDVEMVQHLAREDRARVMACPEGHYRLMLPLPEASGPALLALGTLRGFARTPAETAQEEARLEKWLQAVAQRLRPAARPRDEAAPAAQQACQAILALDHLMRRLRVHKEPLKNQSRALQAAADLLRIRTLTWVPRQPEQPVLTVGEPVLSSWDLRQLAATLAPSPELQKAGLLLRARPDGAWGARFPQVTTLMAVAVGDQAALGWVLAVNRKGQADEPFRRSDAALLTPFVSLLDLHARAIGRYTEIKDLLVGLTRSLTAAIDAKDSYTYGHSERVARVAVELAREMGLSEEEVHDVYLAGLLHDIGKIGVPDAVLSKPGRLTAEEFEQIKQHVTIGYRILRDLEAIRHLLPGVLYHHERYDGQGYPEGLVGEAIPRLARILAVADSFDAMGTTRPYRRALPLAQVEQALREGAGTQWDASVIDAYFRCRERVHHVRQRGLGESLALALDTAMRKGGSSIILPGTLLSVTK